MLDFISKIPELSKGGNCRMHDKWYRGGKKKARGLGRGGDLCKRVTEPIAVRICS